MDDAMLRQSPCQLHQPYGCRLLGGDQLHQPIGAELQCVQHLLAQIGAAWYLMLWSETGSAAGCDGVFGDFGERLGIWSTGKGSPVSTVREASGRCFMFGGGISLQRSPPHCDISTSVCAHGSSSKLMSPCHTCSQCLWSRGPFQDPGPSGATDLHGERRWHLEAGHPCHAHEAKPSRKLGSERLQCSYRARIATWIAPGTLPGCMFKMTLLIYGVTQNLYHQQ